MRRLALLALVTLLVTGSPVRAQEPAPAGTPAEALAEIMEVAKKDASRIRGLPFLMDIPVRKITKDDFRKLMFQRIRELLGEGEKRAHMERLLQRLRVLPEGTGIDDLTNRFFPETVGANYDPFHKRISFLKLYRSRKTQHSVMVHELTHALQDQHFNLSDLVLGGEITFDRLLALGALAEGDAENVQQTFAQGPLFALAPLEMIRKFGQSQIDKYLARMKDFPRGIARPFIFQYMDGLLFIETVKRAGGGFKAVDRMYRDPPASTEQILHPGKYLHRDHPTRILPPEMPEGFTILVDNVLGELGISIVLEANLGAGVDPAVAEGWDGDRILVVRAPSGADLLVWYTTWDTVKDAEEFREAARALLRKRHPGASEETENGTWFLTLKENAHLVGGSGRDVLVLEDVATGTSFELLEGLSEARMETLVLKNTRFGARDGSDSSGR